MKTGGTESRESWVIGWIAIAIATFVFTGDVTANGLPISAPEGDRALILLSSSSVEALKQVEEVVRFEGGRVTFVFVPSIVVAFLPREASGRIVALPEVLDVRFDAANAEAYGVLTREQEAGIAIWNDYFLRPAQDEPPLSASVSAPPRDYACGIPVPAEYREESSGAPEKKGYGAGPTSTSEYMILDGPGSLHEEFNVHIIFPESNGDLDLNQENWIQQDMTTMLIGISAGLDWWAARYGPARWKTVISTTWQVATPWEPIRHPSGFEATWVDDLMDTLGYGGADYFAKVRNFNNNYLVDADEAWFVTIFAVNSQVDPDGKFTNGRYDWSYFGGPYMVLTWDSGQWGNANTDYLTAHELGHTFYALDEYAGCSDDSLSGYLDQPNGNCIEGPEPVVECIMENNTLAEFTNGSVCNFCRNIIGWMDSDGDSIPDIVDHPPLLALNGYGGSTACGALSWSGSVIPEVEPNVNHVRYSTGSSSGDSINVTSVSIVEYRLDGAVWQAATPDDGSWDEANETYSFLASPAWGTHDVEVRATNSRGIESAVARDTVVFLGSDWVDDFEDANISDWTVTNNGATIAVDGSQAQSGIWSVKSTGNAAGGAYASASSSSLDIDFAELYTVSFWYRWNSFHWGFWVLCGHVRIIIDQPTLAIQYDKNGDWSGRVALGPAFQSYCPSNTWKKVVITVDPVSRQYTVDVGGTFVGTATYNAGWDPRGNFYFSDPSGPSDYMTAWYDDVRVNGCSVVATDVAGPATSLPPRVLSLRVAPNPFNPVTTVHYTVPSSGPISLRVYDVAGRLVRTLIEGGFAGLEGHVVWSGESTAGPSVRSGVYFFALEAAGERAVTRVILLR